MTAKNITDFVEIGLHDENRLAIVKCACNAEFGPWEFILSKSDDKAGGRFWAREGKCPKCKRKLFFTATIKVYDWS